MQNNLKITGIQTDLVWEDPQANLKNFDKIINALPATDLIVLPEMFSTGFSMNPGDIADTGLTLNWMKARAKDTGAALCGSVMVKLDGKFYNRFYFVTPQAEVSHYDKRHRFTLAGEHKIYERGQALKIVSYKGWKIALQVCYDLRFPVFSRNNAAYDLLLYVANWPDKRIFAWDTLLKARAIENMAYCMGVNRIGRDGNGHLYTGHSGIYDMLGATMAFAKEEQAPFTANLSAESLQETRRQLNFLADRDSFQLVEASLPPDSI